MLETTVTISISQETIARINLAVAEMRISMWHNGDLSFIKRVLRKKQYNHDLQELKDAQYRLSIIENKNRTEYAA